MSSFSKITGTQTLPNVQADTTALAVQNAQLTDKLTAANSQHTDLMYANTQLLKATKYAALSFGAISLALIGFTIYLKYKGGNSVPVAQAAPALPPPIVVPPATI